MFHLSEETEKRWEEVIESADAPAITCPYKKRVITKLIDNQAGARPEIGINAFNESVGDNTVAGGKVQNWDPVLISMVRRAMPNTIGFDVAGVQPMSQPSQLIFALRAQYNKVDNGVLTQTEAMHKNIDSTFSAKRGEYEGTASQPTAFDGQPELALDGSGDRQAATDSPGDDVYLVDPFATTELEALSGKYDATNNTGGFRQMGISIDKLSVTAEGRALRADYTDEFAQDLKAVHGLNAENELAGLLSTEMLNEINQEVILEVNRKAKLRNDAASYGEAAFDLSTDADGRWMVERFKALVFELELVANDIALDTRRGKGNWVICSSNVASALSAAGVLDSTPGAAGPLNVDITLSTFAGTIGGRMKVYVDPFAVSDYATVGYRGSSPYDAGLFYCPYVPLQLKRATGEEDFQPRIGFKTRYGMSANPFVLIDDGTSKVGDTLSGRGKDRKNNYFRHFAIRNLAVTTA